jgi:hypothetical protein
VTQAFPYLLLLQIIWDVFLDCARTRATWFVCTRCMTWLRQPIRSPDVIQPSISS